MKASGITLQRWMRVGVLASGSMLGATLLAQNTAQNTGKDDLFAGTEKFAQNASNVSEITMDPDTLGLVNGDRAHRAHDMVLNVVRSYGYDKPGLYRMEDVDTFRKKLEAGDWHCSVHTRDLKNGGSTDVCSKRRSDGMVETAIVTVEPKQLTFIHTIRRQGDDHSVGTIPDISGLLDGRGMTQLTVIGSVLKPQLLMQLDAIAPESVARMAALGPEMEARMAAMGARMAAEGARMRAMHPELHMEVHPHTGPGDVVPPPALKSLPAAPSSPMQPE